MELIIVTFTLLGVSGIVGADLLRFGVSELVTPAVIAGLATALFMLGRISKYPTVLPEEDTDRE